jgi:hypothetical protein
METVHLKIRTNTKRGKHLLEFIARNGKNRAGY